MNQSDKIKSPSGKKVRSALFVFAITILWCLPLRAETVTGIPGVASESAVINFQELAAQEAGKIEAKGSAPRVSPRRTKPFPSGNQAQASSSSGFHALSAVGPSPTLATNFPAIDDNQLWIPPDTMGAVGPNHLVVTVNGNVRIQNRAGKVLSTVTLDGFWAKVGPFQAFTFDPNIYYDQAANRFVFVTCADAELGTDAILVGVTQTSDPTGNWNLFKIDADPTNQTWADYPSVGFNDKWIVVAMNMFFNNTPGFKGSQVWVFNKANLYSNAGANYTLFSDNSGFTQAPAVMFESKNPTMYLVETYTQNTLRISTITGPVGSEVFNIGTATVTSTSQWDFQGFTTGVQKGSPEFIDLGDFRVQNVVYRNGSLWCAFTAFLPAGNPTHAAVQWYQLNVNGTILQEGRIEDPNGKKSYAYPSIAVNRRNDVMIGFSTFASDQYASAGFSFRAAGDPINTMRKEGLLKAGEGPYFKDFGSGRNRWGDYSATVVDPLDDINMWTLQEYAKAPSGQSLWGTWWGMINLLEPPDNNLEVIILPVSQTAMLAGSSTNIFVSVNDVFPVTNATVVAQIPGQPDVVFVNNGTGPDATALDNIYSADLLVPSGLPSVQLNFTITAPGKNTFTTNIVYNVFPVPVNDNFTNALKVPSAGAFGNSIITTANQFATIESGEPFHAGVQSRAASLWWNFSSSVDTPVLVDTTGSGIDTVVAVYTGNSVSTLTEVASADDVGNNPDGYLTFNAKAGLTYRIVVAGKTPDQMGLIRLRVEPNGVPDIIPPLITIQSPVSGLVVNTNAIVVQGTASDPQPNSSGLRLVRVSNLSVDPPESVVANGTTNWFVKVQLVEGTNLIEAFSVDFADNRSAAKQITITYKPAPSVNDLFANAVPLTGVSGAATANSSDATKETGEPLHAGNQGGKSLWWTFTPTVNGVLLLNTEGSAFDTLLGVYTGRFVNALQSIASNDDAFNGSGYSEVIMAVTANTTYHIAVDGYAGASGDILLNYTFEPSQVYSVTTSSGTGGRISPSTSSYPANSAVTVTAIPDPYFEFSRFETSNGTVVSTQNPFSFMLTSNTNISAVFQPKHFADDFETGNFSKLPWQNNGFQVQSSVVSRGQYAAASTTHADRQTNSLVLIENLLPGLGSFEYRVSTETNYDKLEFYLNNQLRSSWSGEIPWSTFTFDVPGGITRLEWRYVKDNALSAGFDTVFLDNIDLPLARPTISVSQPNSTDVRLQIQGAPNANYRVEVSSDLVNWSVLKTITTDASGSASFTEGRLTTGTRFYRVVSTQ